MTDADMVETDVCQMAFSPTEAPVYGGGTIVVVLSEEVRFPPGAELFLVYEGSGQRHVSTARQVNDHTLHSAIPCHDCEEAVRLSVQQVGLEEGAVAPEEEYKPRELASTSFYFRYDSALHLARFLLASVYNADSLESLELLRSQHLDLAQEPLPTLDSRLARALRSLPLPQGWHLLGGGPEQEFVQRQTILHFCANLGLFKTAVFLLDKAGSETAIRLPNRQGLLPRDIAHDNGYHELAELLNGYNTHGMVTSEDQHLETDNGVIRTYGSDTTSLTTFLHGSPLRSLEQDIEMLQEVQTMMKRGHSPSCHRPFQSDWPAPQAPESTSEEPMTSEYDTQLEQAIDRLYKEQREHQRQVEQVLAGEAGGAWAQQGEGGAPLGLQDHMDEYNILEGSLSNLREINEGLQQLQEGTLATRLSQDVRKESLSRFSSSCPVLDVQGRASPLLPIDDGDTHHRSMLDLAEDAGPSSSAPVPALALPDSGDTVDSNIRICINDVTVDSSEDFHDDVFRRPGSLRSPGGRGEAGSRRLGTGSQDVSSLRRRSWCPDGGAEAASWTTQKQVKARMLALTGKSMSLNSLDGEEEGEGEEEEEWGEGEEEGEEEFQDAREDPLTPSRAAPQGRPPRSPRRPQDPSLSTADSAGSSPHGRDMPDGGDFLSHASAAMGAAASMNDIHYEMESQSQASPSEKSKGRNFNMASTQGVRSYDEDDHPHGLSVPHSPMTKSLSTPSIPAATEAAAAEERKSGMRRESPRDGKHAQFRRQDEIEEEEDESLSPSQKKTEITLQDFLNDPSNFEGDERVKMTRKEEERKKRKSSVFSRFQNSYRTNRTKKNKEKENKARSTHSFVSVSISNSTTCNVCHKPMANKPALRCENCLVNVHENNCKDHIAPCDKFRNMKGLSRDSHGTGALQERQSASVQGSSLRPTQSFKDKRSASAPVKPQVPPPSQPQLSHRYSLPANSHTISEESETDSLGHGSDFAHTNITETQSESMESLDGVSTTSENFADVDDDPSLQLSLEERETWNLQVDRKFLKKLSAKDIKRQDTIWELIQTEKQYVRSLKVMQKLFSQQLAQELEHLQDVVLRMFPRIDDMVGIHSSFLQQLLRLQQDNTERFVDSIGHVLVAQFTGRSADQMKEVYGVFCSRHKESVQLYKDTIKTDRHLHTYFRKCSNFSWVKRREVPDFILGVTVRLSKYPILIEAILKSTKDKKDRENLSKALIRSKEVLTDVNQRVARYEQLMDIYNRTDSRSTTTFKGEKFKKQDLIAHKRHLLHAGLIGWKSARGRVTEVLAVVLSDLILFASESSGRFQFFIQDNKSCVVPLFKLLVREKRDTRDSHGIYLISQNKLAPEMYELVCRSREDKEVWIQKLQEAISNCPEEEESAPAKVSGVEEEQRKQDEERAAKVKEIMDLLTAKDQEIKRCCEEKDRLLGEMVCLSNRFRESHSGPNSQEGAMAGESLHVLQAAIQEASRLGTFINGSGTQLSRSVSSVGEHVSSSFVAMPIPKRAETFAGFDSSYDIPKMVTKKRFAAIAAQEAEGRSSSLQSLDKGDGDLAHSSIAEEGQQSGEQRLSYPGANAPTTQAMLPQWEEQEMHFLDRTEQGSSLGELSTSSSSSLPVHYAPGTGHAAGPEATPMGSIAQLLKYLHHLMHLTAQQGTAVETLRVQLYAANEKINKLSAEMNERGDRRMGFSHNKLEELRNLQENISREKQEWEQEKARERAVLQREREELQHQRQFLQKQEAELQAKREELKRQRETLQRQMDLLREQQATSSSMPFTGLPHSSSSSSVPASQPAPANPLPKSGPGRWGSPGDKVVHRRSQSADFYQTVASDIESLSQQHMLPEPGTRNPSLSRQPRHSMANIHNFNNNPGPKSNLPMHLLSAKNEQKMGGVKVQQLPMKLSGNVSASATAFGGAGSVLSSSSSALQQQQQQQQQGGAVTVTGTQQVLPFKLASSSHPSSSTSPASSLGPRSGSSFSHQPPPPHLGPGLGRNPPSHSAPSLAGLRHLAESSSSSSLPGSKNKGPSPAAAKNPPPAQPHSSQHSNPPSGPPNPPAEGADSSGIIYF